MSIRYAVISRGRAETIRRKTLAALTLAGVERADVDVFVHPSEVDKYEAHNPGWSILPGGENLNAQRTKVMGHYPPGAKVVSCDDDVRKWITLTETGEKTDLTDFPDFAARMFSATDQLGAGIWGVYPADNPRFMSKYVVSGLHFLIGQTYGFISRGSQSFKVEAAPKDDWWITLESFERDGAVVRCNAVACGTEMYGAGGISDLTADRRAMNEAATLKILERFGHLVEEKRSLVGEDREIRVSPEVVFSFRPNRWAWRP